MNLKVYPCFCIQMDTKSWIAYILFVDKYIYTLYEKDIGYPRYVSEVGYTNTDRP